MSDTIICPVCGEGYLEQHTDFVEIQYREIWSQRPMLYSVCSGVCGSIVGTVEQSRINREDTRMFKKQVDHYLDGDTSVL
jgi:hypothetical protein